VLAESSEIKSDAFHTLYEEFGPEAAAKVVAYHRRHGGLSRLIKIQHCHREILGIELDDEALAAWGGRYARLVEEAVYGCAWVAGARDLLEAIRDRLKTFVVSGTPQAEMERVVAARGMDGYFTEVFGSPPLKDRKVREVLDKYRLRPERCLFVGDAMTDYDAARDTGLDFVGRVAPGWENPFPAGTAVIPDFRGFDVR